MALNKLSLYKGGNTGKARILLLAPKGVAATNIGGTTIKTALWSDIVLKLAPFSDDQKFNSHIKLIITDEISMVSSKKFFSAESKTKRKFLMWK